MADITVILFYKSEKNIFKILILKGETTLLLIQNIILNYSISDEIKRITPDENIGIQIIIVRRRH